MTLRLLPAVRVLALLLLAASPLARSAAAQEIRALDERVSTAPGYFVYVLPGERSVQASVLGTVRAPGFYTLSNGTDLGEALALAGGPLLGPQSTDVDRTVTIRLYRGAGTRELVYESTLEDFARVTTPYPALVDGDLIEVTTLEDRRRTWRDTLAVVGGASGVVIALVQIISILR